MKATRTKKNMSIVLAASMLLAMGVTAFATETVETDTARVENQRGFFRGNMKAPGVRLAIGQNILEDLVENGSISEGELEAIENFLEEQRNLSSEDRVHPEEGEGPLDYLVEEKVITQDTADDILAGIEVLRDDRRTEFIESVIDEGILTEAEMAEVTDFMDDFRVEREEMREELSEMTRDERRDYFEENKNDFEGPIESMVDEGMISEDQADAIRNLMPGNGQRDGNRGPKGQNLNMERGPKNGMFFGDRNGAGLNLQMNCEEL
ncbi:MAG: hypothetical protein JJE29_05525 [Peptostreptococcaceae bacterium]|nr:hypothetical protein [Peptostreptococcaceae bacterium]